MCALHVYTHEAHTCTMCIHEYIYAPPHVRLYGNTYVRSHAHVHTHTTSRESGPLPDNVLYACPCVCVSVCESQGPCRANAQAVLRTPNLLEAVNRLLRGDLAPEGCAYTDDYAEQVLSLPFYYCAYTDDFAEQVASTDDHTDDR